MFIREYFFSIEVINNRTDTVTNHTGFIKYTSFFPQPSKVLSRIEQVITEDDTVEIRCINAFNRIDN